MENRIYQIWTVLGVLALSGCAHSHEQVPSDQQGPKLFALDCGQMKYSDIRDLSPGYPEHESKELVSSCYLVKHPKGLLLWEAGIDDQISAQKDGVQVAGGAIRLTVTTGLARQLSALGVSPDEVSLVSTSHMHPDHTGNLNLFQNSKFLIQRAEYEDAFGPEPEKFRYRKETYSKLNQQNIVRIEGIQDVFGDKSVVLYPAPGHTPGHQVLYVNLRETGPVVLSGDLYHFSQNRELKRVPKFNFDAKKTTESMETIEALIQAKHASLWIEHDPNQPARKMKLPAEFR